MAEVSKAVLTVHRDFGDRSDRKHARLKYTIEDNGLDWFRTELEKQLDDLSERLAALEGDSAQKAVSTAVPSAENGGDE